MTALDRMIDAVVKCTKCGARPGACRCWVTLECPGCRRKRSVARDKTDPPAAIRIVVSCPDCCDEARILDYFDDAGRQIMEF